MSDECCGFELFNPVKQNVLSVSSVGLYNDARFRGRLIVKLNEHYPGLEFLPSEMLCEFMLDVQRMMIVVKDVTGCDKVNVAVLGNTVEHVHAHLIPRYYDVEVFPHKSPWNDPRELEVLSVVDKRVLVSAFEERLSSSL